MGHRSTRARRAGRTAIDPSLGTACVVIGRVILREVSVVRAGYLYRQGVVSRLSCRRWRGLWLGTARSNREV
jgi:hypothetical protein